MSKTVCIEIPVELLPDVVEMLTSAFVNVSSKADQKQKRVSDLEFELDKLRNRNEYLEAENRRLTARKEANDDF